METWVCRVSLSPFKIRNLMSYAASGGDWRSLSAGIYSLFLETVWLKVCIVKVALKVLTDPGFFLASLTDFCFSSAQVIHLLQLFVLEPQNTFPYFHSYRSILDRPAPSSTVNFLSCVTSFLSFALFLISLEVDRTNTM